MISIITWTHNWQKMFDHTIIKWMEQTYPEFEIVAGCGPSITTPINKRIRHINIEGKGKCAAYNILIDRAVGDMLLLTQADMEVNDPCQLERMLKAWTPGKMVTERFFKDGKRDDGLFPQFMLVSKMDVKLAGKFDEAFDSPDMYGYEDTDFVMRLMEMGIKHEILTTPEDIGVYHLWHPGVDMNDPVISKKIATAGKLYIKKHGTKTIKREHERMVAKV